MYQLWDVRFVGDFNAYGHAFLEPKQGTRNLSVVADGVDMHTGCEFKRELLYTQRIVSSFVLCSGRKRRGIAQR